MMERKPFAYEVKDRFKAPWTSVFIGYFLILIAAGGISVLVTSLDVSKTGKLPDESFKIAETLGTFFIAIVATSFVDLNLCTKIQNKKAFMMWSYLLAGFSVLLFWTTYQLKSYFSFLPSITGTLLALCMWVIANADNDKIIKEDDFFNEMRGKGLHDQSWE